MSFWRKLGRGLRALSDPKSAEQDVADEVQYFLEQAAADNAARGMRPADAERAARVEFGSIRAVREEVSSYGWENLVITLAGDFRYAARRLRGSPGFSIIGVLTLALGIGAATAIFSAVNPILFQPLPYPNAKQLLIIWDIFQGSRSEVTFHTYRELAERSRSFRDLAVMETWQPSMAGTREPERLDGQSVSASYFRVLGVSPVLGRDFQASDDVHNGPKVAILSDRLWRRRFGSDPFVVGRQVRLDDTLYTVIGVMPRSFENVLLPSAEIWSSLRYDPQNTTAPDTTEWGHHLRMIGRLRPGVRSGQARSELDTIAHSPVAEFPRVRWAALQNGFIVDALQDQVTRAVKPALLAVLGAVTLVLLIACVNVTNILLARGVQRRGEFAMRAALGAPRQRLIRQLLTESLLLALLGGLFGMVVAEFGVRALVAMSPPGLPRVSAIRVDRAVLMFAFAVTTLVGMLVGLIPAMEASHGNLALDAKQSSRSVSGRRQTARRLLVVAEVALALVLLTSAGLLLHSLQRLFAVDAGFDVSRLLTMQVQTSGHRFDDPAARRRFFDQSLEAVRSLPGVKGAAFTSLLPLSDDPFGEYGAFFENDNSGRDVFRYAVTPGYFETMGIALRQGRFLDAHDTEGAPLAVVISDSLARSQFPSQDPIGQRVHVGPTNRPWYAIVGVVSDVKQASLAEAKPDAVYMTPAQSWFADDAMSLVVRPRGDLAAITPGIRKAIWSVDKDQPIIRVATMENLLAATAADRHFALLLFGAFGVVALVLAAIGIYGVLSGNVTERIREIGVRAALGASPRDIVSLVVRQGMQLTALGVAIGLGIAALASHALVTLLFGISQLDPATYIGVIVLLTGVSAIACSAPAWRAASVDPSITLRAE